MKGRFNFSSAQQHAISLQILLVATYTEDLLPLLKAPGAIGSPK